MGSRRGARDIPLRDLATTEPIIDYRSAHVPAGEMMLEGTLNLPQQALAVVLFAHGSGSGRHSPRNRHVANVLNEARLATLLIDLLTPEEEESASTGAAAALVAVAQRPDRVGALVSRGGRPDLAGTALLRVRAPTLLIAK